MTPGRSLKAEGGVRNRAHAAGFSLIEVILAIALSAALMSLLAWGFNLYLVRVDSSQSAVLNSQLARSVLRLIGDDVRSAATYFEQDISVAEELAAAQASFDVEEVDDLGTEESTEDDESRRPIGLYGDAVSLMLDVHKSRPVDPAIEYGAGELQEASTALTGMTTVRYFVGAEGLVRQEASRDVNVWESDSGMSESLEASSRVIAPEVVDIRFIYSDGEQTADAWDSEEQEGLLPVAIEVQLTLRDATQNAEMAANAVDVESLRTYRMVIAMPSSNPPVEEETDQTTEESEVQ